MPTKIPVALQLYSVRDDYQKDIAGTLASVAKMGYDGVEFYGDWPKPAREIQRMLNDNGLGIAGWHVGWGKFNESEIERTIEYHRELGNRFLICPGVPESERSTAQAWKRLAERFNAIAERLKSEGMFTGYHNHENEFQPLDGQVPMDLFFGNTRPEVVMQLDIGNAMIGGSDSLPFMDKYPGRTQSIHLKEYSAKDKDALIGEGEIPWQRVFAACEGPGATEWYIIEQEGYRYPPLECARRCRENLRKLGR